MGGEGTSTGWSDGRPPKAVGEAEAGARGSLGAQGASGRPWDRVGCLGWAEASANPSPCSVRAPDSTSVLPPSPAGPPCAHHSHVGRLLPCSPPPKLDPAWGGSWDPGPKPGQTRERLGRQEGKQRRAVSLFPHGKLLLDLGNPSWRSISSVSCATSSSALHPTPTSPALGLLCRAVNKGESD